MASTCSAAHPKATALPNPPHSRCCSMAEISRVRPSACSGCRGGARVAICSLTRQRSLGLQAPQRANEELPWRRSSPVPSSPVQSSPVQSPPVQPSPVQPSPVQSSQAQSKPSQTQSNPVRDLDLWRRRHVATQHDMIHSGRRVRNGGVRNGVDCRYETRTTRTREECDTM